MSEEITKTSGALMTSVHGVFVEEAEYKKLVGNQLSPAKSWWDVKRFPVMLEAFYTPAICPAPYAVETAEQRHNRLHRLVQTDLVLADEYDLVVRKLDASLFEISASQARESALREKLEAMTVERDLYASDAKRCWSHMPELADSDADYELHEAVHELKQRAKAAEARLLEAKVPGILFDGFAVYQEVKINRPAISANAVSDVLDAVVRIIRAQPPKEPT